VKRLDAKRVTAVAATLCVLAALAATASAEVTQKGNLRVSFSGGISPHALPRQGTAPVTVDLAGEIKTVDGQDPPQLRTIALAINRNGRLDYTGLPACHYHEIQPASTAEAIESCPRSVVGTGTFSAHVVLPEQSPFPSAGKMIAFNGVFKGRHVLFAHIYGTRPLPQSTVLAFAIGRTPGTYGTTLSAQLPKVAAEWGYVSGVSLSLRRNFKYKGKPRSFISAGCPAAPGFPGATFPFAKASFGFEDGRTLASVLTRSCAARG
jgi:hypothetical protein